MRKKAERQIRNAAALLVSPEGRFRLDLIRFRAGLHPKVYDKTILDMARVGTIALYSEDTSGMDPSAVSALVRRGDIIFTHFIFIDGTTFDDAPSSGAEAPPPLGHASPEPVVVILENLTPMEWAEFENRCQLLEQTRVTTKIEAMIREFLRSGR